jgi:hypothetical protein
VDRIAGIQFANHERRRLDALWRVKPSTVFPPALRAYNVSRVVIDRERKAVVMQPNEPHRLQLATKLDWPAAPLRKTFKMFFA